MYWLFRVGVEMKVVLFCGGQGTRIRDYSDQIPKPLVPIDGVPILLHIMKYYAAFGHKDFILCLGYKGKAIRKFFLEFNECMSSDFVLDFGRAQTNVLEPALPDWRITFIDTGTDTNIGGRLLRVKEHLAGEDMFFANYADILSDLDLDVMLAQFRVNKAIAAFCCVRPPYSFHTVNFGAKGMVSGLTEMRQSGAWMNGGFMILRRQIFDYLHPRRGAGQRGVRAADPAEPALRPQAHGLLDADGHLQGKAGLRRHGRPRRHALAGLEPEGARCRACRGLNSEPSSPSEPTATISRSGPARRCCG